jgi:hypothetical protein
MLLFKLKVEMLRLGNLTVTRFASVTFGVIHDKNDLTRQYEMNEYKNVTITTHE